MTSAENKPSEEDHARQNASHPTGEKEIKSRHRVIIERSITGER